MSRVRDYLASEVLFFFTEHRTELVHGAARQELSTFRRILIGKGKVLRTRVVISDGKSPKRFYFQSRFLKEISISSTLNFYFTEIQ